jgi:hypothetical protein
MTPQQHAHLITDAVAAACQTWMIQTEHHAHDKTTNTESTQRVTVSKH